MGRRFVWHLRYIGTSSSTAKRQDAAAAAAVEDGALKGTVK